MSKALGIIAVVATLIAAATNGVRGGDYSTSDQEYSARSVRGSAQARRLSQIVEPLTEMQTGQERSPSGAPARSAILGKGVRSNAGEDMGRIVDIIVSGNGQIHAAIIDFGGFLGIGIRKIAVDWNALNFAPVGKPGTITLELTRNQVRLAPEYKRGVPVVVVGAASGSERVTRSREATAPDR
jgi:hypothetical protein